jgi:hypothetical protein
MKNNLLKAQQAARNLSNQIKKETERIKALKDQLHKWQDAGGKSGGPTWRDRWSRRKEPVVLIEDINVARKKKDRDKKYSPPAEIARLVLPTRNQR